MSEAERPIAVMIIPSVRVAKLDAHNWCVERMHVAKKGKRAGEQVWERVGYYGSLGAAARSLLNDHVDLILGTPQAFADVRALVAVVREGHRTGARALRGGGRRMSRPARGG